MDRSTVNLTGLTTLATRERSPVRSWHCLVSTGDQAGAHLSIGSRPVIVGADSSCDVVLSDPTVSRRHAELSLTRGGICLRDLGSTNGTLYQSSRVQEILLASAATVRVGNTELRLSPEAPPTLPPSARERFGALLGRSLAMRELFGVLELSAPTEATVLIEGESGTGKELAALALHDHSSRAAGPFVVVDCSATDAELVSSQLFGHLKGAFTGATTDRRGAFEAANGGTLFLDELGELPAQTQAKLLRALEARTIQPLGAEQRRPIDVRVIAATHRDLSRMVAAETFRFDLYQRLAVVHVRLPPLRERLEDLPLLVRAFFEGRSIEVGDLFGPNLTQLERYDWPGNVRELRNVLERAWVLSGARATRFSELSLSVGAVATQSVLEAVETHLPFKEAKDRWLSTFERRYIAEIYHAHGGNISQAATFAGINRNHFRSLLEKHHLLEP